MTLPWNAAFDEHCRRLIETLVNETGSRKDVAWKQLLIALSPHIEIWAARSRLLRRWRLTSPDEPREVLLLAIERMLRNDHANFRAFLARPGAKPPRPEGCDERADSIARLSSLLDVVEEVDAEEQGSPTDDIERTPLRAWMKGLVDYAIRDHLYARLGRADGKLAADGGTKRDLHSDAKPLVTSDAGGTRPPMTDALTLRRIASEIARFAEERLTPEQWRAVRMKSEDASFEEIALAMQLDGPEAARKLVRSGTERLRSHFKAQWRELTGA